MVKNSNTVYTNEYVRGSIEKYPDLFWIKCITFKLKYFDKYF